MQIIIIIIQDRYGALPPITICLWIHRLVMTMSWMLFWKQQKDLNSPSPLVIMTKKLYNNLEIHTGIVFSGRCLLSLNISKGASNNERIEMGSTGHRRDCQ